MRAELTGFPSIDKLWLKYYGEEVLHRPLPEGSMYDYLTSCNVDRMDEAALNYFGKKVTHRHTTIIDGKSYLESLIAMISRNWENPTFHPTIEQLWEFREKWENKEA